MATWLGVDVGGPRKRFDAAVIDEHGIRTRARRASVTDVIEFTQIWAPELVAVDRPCCWAADGATCRTGERLLNAAVCGIRWTPDRHVGSQGDYYAWIREGLALYQALELRELAVIEVFPTASWTRWAGPRGAATRAWWSREALAQLSLEALPARTNQDQRDAIAAAVTARQHSNGEAEAFGEIVVPSVSS